MIPVFTKKDSFALDEFTITSNHLSQEGLMDNAGRSIAQFIVENIHNPFNQNFIVIYIEEFTCQNYCNNLQYQKLSIYHK